MFLKIIFCTLLSQFAFSNDDLVDNYLDEEELILNRSPASEVKKDNKRVVYVYKQFEKIDFDDLEIQGDTGSPNDLTISPIHEKRFTNELPYRKNFRKEIFKSIERIQ